VQAQPDDAGAAWARGALDVVGVGRVGVDKAPPLEQARDATRECGDDALDLRVARRR
jgi:hypothetical protein